MYCRSFHDTASVFTESIGQRCAQSLAWRAAMRRYRSRCGSWQPRIEFMVSALQSGGLFRHAGFQSVLLALPFLSRRPTADGMSRLHDFCLAGLFSRLLHRSPGSITTTYCCRHTSWLRGCLPMTGSGGYRDWAILAGCATSLLLTGIAWVIAIRGNRSDAYPAAIPYIHRRLPAAWRALVAAS